MTIASAICNTFKVEILKAVHNFTASSGNTFNLAMYTSSASMGASTTAYTTTNEIANTSGSSYSAKGKALTSVTPVLSSDINSSSLRYATLPPVGSFTPNSPDHICVFAFSAYV